MSGVVLICFKYFTIIYSYVRNTEDVKVMIKHAKLEETDLNPLTQAIYFSSKCEEYKLLELNSSLLNSLREGQK